MDGAGSETYRFRSKKLRMRAIQTDSGVSLIALRGLPRPKVAGTLTRRGSIVTGPSEEICSYGDGTGEVVTPPAPDCGRRKIRQTIEIAYGVNAADFVHIDDGDTGQDPYANCPTGVTDQFPYLMGFDNAGQRVGQRLPVGDLFGYGKNVVIARGTRTSEGETTALTTIRWTASFTRVKPRR